MPGLSECYIGITSSQLSPGQILQHCRHVRPTHSLDDRTRSCGGILVATDGAVGGFEGNLPNHATPSRSLKKK
jgi:hypothetical protein